MLRYSIRIAIALCLIATPFATAQTSRPAAGTSPAAEDQAMGRELIRGDQGPSKPLTANSTTLRVGTSGALDLVRIAIALAIVIGVILLLRVVVQNLGKLPGSRKSGKLVTVLSRSIISAKQQVLVLQVGRRLIIVGDSCGHMNPLCEISDPDEMAELVGQTRNEQQSRAARTPATFGNLFQRANEPFSETELLQPQLQAPTQNIESVDGVTSEDVSGLLNKVRMLQQQFKH